MNTNKCNASRWLYCISGDKRTNNLWSRLNLEGSGITWAGNPVRARKTGLLALLASLPVTSHTDNNNWTSEVDALGNWSALWEL